MQRTKTGAIAARLRRAASPVVALAGSRAVFALDIAAVFVCATAIALHYRPQPFSDWRYYWNAAGDFGLYERGGAALALLAALKSFGWPPYLTGLLLNLAAAAAILACARRADATAGRWLCHLVALYLLLIAGFFGLVQLDLVAVAWLAAGCVLWFRPPRRWRPWPTAAVAALSIAFAVSTRPQLLLVLGVFAGLIALAACTTARVKREHTLVGFAALLIVAALAGFALDSGLRAAAGRSGAVRTNSAVTLYSGLLDSSTDPNNCGQWSVHATVTLHQDLDRPLAEAAIARLRAQPPRHWLAVMRCKLPQILTPSAFSTWWLFASPNVAADARAQPERAQQQDRILGYESRAYTWWRRLAYLAAIAACVCCGRRRRSAWLPLLWPASFLLVHLVFEVQGRYFLSMLLLLPVMTALALRPMRAAAVDTMPATPSAA